MGERGGGGGQELIGEWGADTASPGGSPGGFFPPNPIVITPELLSGTGVLGPVNHCPER